jgi:PAS domain S-box-containing protein
MVQPKRKKSVAVKKNKVSLEKTTEEVTQFSSVSTLSKKFEQELHLDESIFDEVVDYALIMLDTKGTITAWNKGAEKIKGYSAKEIIGKNYRIFYTKEDKQEKLSEKLLAEAAKKTAGRTMKAGAFEKMAHGSGVT